MTFVIVVGLVLIAAVIALGRMRLLSGLATRIIALGGAAYLLAFTLTHVRVSVNRGGFVVCMMALLGILTVAAWLAYRGLLPVRRRPTL